MMIGRESERATVMIGQERERERERKKERESDNDDRTRERERDERKPTNERNRETNFHFFSLPKLPMHIPNNNFIFFFKLGQ